ncbi:MAG TPA: MarR family transcriptional regulator [Polyangiaceae bacterium]
MSKRLQRSLGVTGPQRLVLRLVGHFGSASPGDLALVLHVHPSSITGVLRRLDRARLIRRTRDPGDARRSILVLTPRGRRLVKDSKGTVEAAVQATLSRFPQKRINAVREVLTSLASELDSERPR